MKAFVAAMVAIVVISAAAGFGLQQAGMSASDVHTTSSVRLN